MAQTDKIRIIKHSKLHTKKILVAPLNWGIGHATRCIPIINLLLDHGYQPIIASDGDALLLLQKEFPKLKRVQLPSYNIRYPRNGKWLQWKLLLQSPIVLRAVKLERKKVREIIQSEGLIGIISDNRPGVWDAQIPSVYITHQLTVLSGMATFISSKIHQYWIRNFEECWIPDNNHGIALSGRLGESNSILNVKRIGVLSRLKKLDLKIQWDLLVLLSGVEPQRQQLEEQLITELKYYKGKVLFVKGKIETLQVRKTLGNITYCNFLTSSGMEKAINESDLVLARSGYSTIMDLAKLEKKAFFIPTKGQSEQEYLAKHLASKGIAPYSNQGNFKLEQLDKVHEYRGFKDWEVVEMPKDLFHLFEGK